MRYLSSIISSCIGNILEWYDFGLFTIFSVLFSQLFFPTENPHVAIIATFGIFAIGFLCRPIGALIFGYLGDRNGRAKTLRLSVLMISLPTLLIGLIPTYHQVGILAPIMLIIIRMWQGISIGGEYGGNLIYLAETAPIKYRATLTSFASTGANFGILLAALVGMLMSRLLSEQALEAWGWRIPYLASGILCLLIYRFRLRIHETAVFDYLRKHHKLVGNPIKAVFKHNIPQLLRTVGLVCMGSTFYYFCFIYIPLFLSTNKLYSTYDISILISTMICIMIVLVPMVGYICDKLGRRKMLLFNAALITLIVIPGFYFLQWENTIILIAMLSLFAIASALEQGTTSVTVVENFPPPARYTGVSLGYNLGNGLLGGTVPVVCEWLISATNISVSPAFYIAFCAVITGLVVWFTVPETRGNNLDGMSN